MHENNRGQANKLTRRRTLQLIVHLLQSSRPPPPRAAQQCGGTAVLEALSTSIAIRVQALEFETPRT
eukprot:6087197-Amphidinium_carterae.2